MPTSASVEILLIEDSPGDARLMRDALDHGSISKNINHVEDGEQALDFLRQHGDFQDAPRPDLILLDLKLPKVSGLEVLREIKTDGALRLIPVIVLTSSAIEEDIHRAYDLQANCYLGKPFDIDGYEDLAKSVEDFWLQNATLPRSALG